MKVLLVSHSSQLNGAERSLFEIATAAAKVASVHVTLPSAGPLKERLSAAGIHSEVVPTHSWMGPRHRSPGGVVRLVQCAVDSVRFRRVIKSIQPDLVVVNTSITPGPALAARRLGVPTCWIVREAPRSSTDLVSIVPLGLRVYLMKRWSTWLGVISEYVADELGVTTRGGDVIVMPPSPTIETPGSASDRAWTGGPLRLVAVGRIAPDKGTDFSIRALSLAVEGGADAYLTIVGHGDASYVSSLRALVRSLDLEERVTFAGWLDEPQSAYRDADAMLMSASQEPYGRVTAEALLAGIPVIARPRGGTPEVLERCSECVLRDDSTHAMASRIIELSGLGAEDRAALQAHVSAHSARLATQRGQFDRILEFYEPLAGRSSS